MPPLFRQFAECAVTALPLGYLTSQQPQGPTRYIIMATTIGYGVLYGILCYIEQQQQSSASKDHHALHAAESKSRFLSTVNAILLTIGSILCYIELAHYEDGMGWIGGRTSSSSPSHDDDNIHDSISNMSYPAIFASFFVAFLQFDFLWMVWHRLEYNDVSAMIHHVLFLCMTHYVLSGPYFLKPFAWLSLTELSTPFLNLRWWYAANGRKDHAGYLYCSLAFASTFVVTRIGWYGLGLMDVYRHYHHWRSVLGLHAVAVGLVFGYILNCFWAVKILRAVQRVLSKSSSKGGGTKEKKKE